MPEPLRSPKQSRVSAKNKSHPYPRPANSHRARDVGLTRSNSLLGTIKSFVTAPLSWLSLGDSQESNDSPQKRRVSGSERGGTPPRAKRVRRDSTEVGGHLDPPSSLFPTTRPPISVWNNVNGVAPVRTMSLDPLRPSTDRVERPLLPFRRQSILSRASTSVEPQDKSALRRSNTRELSMPPPPPFARSYSRSSLTPQPSGATFGPSPRRKPRESTAPPLLPSPAPTFTRPPLESSRQQGLFQRAPSREMSEGPISALLGRNRQSVSPMREISSQKLLVPNEVPVFRSSNNNTVERTLSTLESYRTPLHTSRFPSPLPTDEHRPRKVHVPMPSKLSFDHTPEGRKEKAKRGPTVVGPYSSGMSGMRKLLARRREELERDADLEGEVSSEHPRETEAGKDDNEMSKDEDMMMEDKVEEVEPPKAHPQVNGVTGKTDAQLPRTRSPPRSKPDGPYSSLRAPSNRVSRTHAPAPRLKKTRNKFALDDDDDTDWSMSVEDVKKYQAQVAHTQSPISFSHPRSMSETGMQTDTDSPSLLRTKTPPLPSQPQTFDSLLSRIGPPLPTAAKPAASFPTALTVSQPKPDNQATSQPAEAATVETSSAPVTLPFNFGTPPSVPKHVEAGVSPFASKTVTPCHSPSPVAAPPTSNANGVPTFFANTKTQFTPPKVPSGSLFGGVPPGAEKNDAAEQPKSVFGAFGGVGKEEAPNKTETQKEQKPSPFGEVSKPSAFGGTLASFGGDSSKLGNAVNNTTCNTAPAFTGFGTTATSAPNEAPKPSFSFGAPAADSVAVSSPGISIFGAASKPDTGPLTSTGDTSSKPSLSFPAAPQTSTPSADKPEVAKPEAPAAAESSKRAFSFDARPEAPMLSGQAPKSQFPFANPTLSTSLTNTTPEVAKSPFSFGATPSTPPLGDKKGAFAFGNASGGGTSGFSFGSNSLSTGVANGTTADAPKPVFGGFGNTSTPTYTPAQKSAETAQAESGDGMEVNGGDRMEESPTRAIDKKDAPVPQVTQASPFTGFGAGSSSGGFSFGQAKPPASTGGFSFGQSTPSTGTAFGFGQTADKSTINANSSTVFNFGQSPDKPASPALSTAFAFGNDTSKSLPQSQSSFGAPLNNPFGTGSTSNPTPSPTFAFGQSNTNAIPNPFGQPQQPENGTSSAPNSPSLFPQQTTQTSQPQSPSFSFSVPGSNSFPAPNTVAGTSTSVTTQPFQFGASGSTQQQPGAAGGPAMFTLGGAATPPRKVKGLPSRRARRP